MKKISEKVMVALRSISRHTDQLYLEENIKYIRSKSQSKKAVSEDKVNKLIDQLPDGLWTSLNQLESEIINNCKKIRKDSICYSPFVSMYKELQPCKLLKYSSGNIITGRDKEIDEVLTTLSKKNKRGVILVGEPGTGKTSIVQAINAKLIEHNVPRKLIGCSIFNMDVPYIFSKNKEDPIGTIVNILETANHYDKAILFIDEVHQLLGHKMNDLMKPYLTERMRFIGSTTLNEYYNIITNDTALERRFTVIMVDEPNINQTIEMVKNTKSVFEEYHSCIIPDDVCKYLVESGSRFLGHRKNPDKSLDLLDIACSIMYEKDINTIHEKITRTGNPLTDVNLLMKEISSIKDIPGERTLNLNYINLAISAVTGINYNEIVNSLEYNKVVENITSKVVGQKEQIKTISNIVNIFKSIKNNRERPISSLLLVGPRGVGKKTVAKLLAKNLFGRNASFIEYDMSGMTSEAMITELKGAPPGYVGYERSGGLVKAIRNNPQSLVYFKNTNKAHDSIQEYVINSQQNGVITDSAERVANLNNIVIIHGITLNDKEKESVFNTRSKTMGFTTKNNDSFKINIESLKEIIGDNLYNSVNEVIVFDELTKEQLETIYNNNVDTFLSEYDIDINKEELKSTVLNNATNGKEVVNKLSSEVPKLVFKTLKKENIDESVNTTKNNS